MPSRSIAVRVPAGFLASVLFAMVSSAQVAVPAADPAMAARGYADVGSANAPAVNAREAPVTAQLNGEAAASAAADTDAQAQYQADRVAYMAALARHDAAVDRSDARYARQQGAYADAMAAWRLQVQACKHGSRRACDLPPPNVQDYY